VVKHDQIVVTAHNNHSIKIEKKKMKY